MLKRAMFLVLVMVALLPFAAPLLAATHPVAAWLIRDFFSRLCHQDADRSLLLWGSPVAVCVRCLGIYLGAAAGALLRVESHHARLWLAAGLALNAMDVTAELLAWHGNWPLERFLLGLVLGTGAGALLAARSYVSAR